MAVGRLNRETNPMPGEKPGFLPQHELADGSFQTTGVNNPLPVGNYVQNDSGLWVPVSKNNPMPTQLTGSIVELELEEREILAGGWRQWPVNSGGYKYVILGVGNDEPQLENGHTWFIDVSFQSQSGRNIYRKINIFQSKKNRDATDWLPVRGERLILFINNTDQESSHIYTPFVRLSKF